MVLIKELSKEEEVSEFPDIGQDDSNPADTEEEENLSSGGEASTDDAEISADENDEQRAKEFVMPSAGNSLPDDIKLHGNLRRKVKFQPADTARKADTDGSKSEPENDEQHTSCDEPKKRVKRKPKKDEKLFAKRAIALFMLFPMVAGVLAVLSEVFTHFSMEKSMITYAVAFVAGAAVATYFISKLGLLGSVFKFAFFLLPAIFLLPSYQTYACSPIPLKNDMLGTYFKLNTNANSFLELTYVGSECFKSLRIHSPYMLSFFQPRIALLSSIDDIIQLSQDETSADEQSPFSLYMLASKRSVKKEFHKLHLVVQAVSKVATVVNEAMKMPPSERNKKLLRLTGRILDMPPQMQSMKAELEGLKHNIRPIVFDVFKVEYVDRYSKPSFGHDEDLE